MKGWKTYLRKRIATVAHCIADRLQQKTETYSVKTKKYLLVIFCMLFAGSSVLVIVNAFRAKQHHIIRVEAIPSPNIIHDQPKPDAIITKQEWEKIERYKTIILSLPKITYDSLMRVRPHLMDSIRLFENLYSSSIK